MAYTNHAVRSQDYPSAEEAGCPGPHGSPPLVDQDLSPQARQAASLVKLSLIKPTERRAVAVFLGQADYQELSCLNSELMASLLLESLGRFVHANGGEIVHSMAIGNQGQVLNAIQQTIEMDGQTLVVLNAGMLFIHFPQACRRLCRTQLPPVQGENGNPRSLQS